MIHTPRGHTNHYWKDISNTTKAKMKRCAWLVRLANIESEVAINLGEVDAKIKMGKSGVCQVEQNQETASTGAHKIEERN